MKIKKVECWAHPMKLKEPYTIAYETIEACTNVFIRAETDDGFTGWGCAAPDIGVTGETMESVMQAYNDVIEPNLIACDPGHYLYLNDQMKAHLGKDPSALAMADMLLYDLIARKAGLPLYKLLGGYRKNMATSITIGILPVDETVKRAKEFIQQGFFILKIKGGSNLDEDVEKINKVREAVGDDVELRFDANQGYDVEQSVQFIRRTASARLELVEQPTTRDQNDLLGKVSHRVPVPVMADESLTTLKDVFKLTSNDFIDMINIKLMKVGGITEAMHINSVAKSAGVEAMVGCMDESALGIAAGLHFALSRPNIAYADLDGHLDLIGDPFKDIFRLEKGVLYPGDGPGLGVIKLQ